MIYWSIEHRDSIHCDTSMYDTICFDPPYDGDFYKKAPVKRGKNKTLIVWTSSKFIDIVFKEIPRLGWFYKYLVVWDTQSCWYTHSRIIQRDNICIVFSDNEYNETNAIFPDNNYRPSACTRNERGSYKSKEKIYSNMTTIFSKNRAQIKKTHKHEKPVEIMAGIFGSLGSVHVLDMFAGGGSFIIAAYIAGVKTYKGYEIDINVIPSINTINETLQKCKTIEQIKEWHSPTNFNLFPEESINE